MHILSSGLHSLQQLVIIKEIRHLLWKLEVFSHIKFCYVVEFTGCYGSPDKQNGHSMSMEAKESMTPEAEGSDGPTRAG